MKFQDEKKSKFNLVHFFFILLGLAALTLIGLLFRDDIDYHFIIIAMLSFVGIIAIVQPIFPVLITCVLSAFIINFFFMVPYNTFHISNPNDVLLLFIFLIVAVLHSVLSYKIKIEQKQARMRAEKERELELYSNVFNSLSHELKTPLATILASTDNLLFNQQFLNDIQKRTLTEQIAIAGNRLNDQVSNLLNMNRIEHGILKPKLDWVHPNELISTVIQSIKNSRSVEIFHVENNRNPLLKTDAGFVSEILKNLVENAFQHNNNSCKVEIQDSIIQDNTWCIYIIDHGQGVPEHELQLLFEKFFRGSNAVKGGTGLGLSIVKGFLDALGGKITVVKNEYGGLTFAVNIPIETSYINNVNIE
ncbi:MAG: DUF4118 domain-containing protein [Chitinophagaceae bacterium]|nr:DUF4118 domain-containing protein [Chitinophagaceae bacterium]